MQQFKLQLESKHLTAYGLVLVAAGLIAAYAFGFFSFSASGSLGYCPPNAFVVSNSIFVYSSSLSSQLQPPAISANGSYMYVPDFSDGLLSIIATSNNRLVTNIPLGQEKPIQVVLSQNGRYAYVLGGIWGASIVNGVQNGNPTPKSSIVSIVSLSNLTLVGKISVNTNASSIELSPDGNYLYVASGDGPGGISVISTQNNTVIKNMTVNAWPYGLAVTPNGQYIYAANYSLAGTVLVVSVPNDTLVNNIIAGSGPYDPVITQNGKYVYVTNVFSGNITVIDTADNRVVTNITVGFLPKFLVNSPSENYAYVSNEGSNSISVIATFNNMVINTIPLNSYPGYMQMSPNGRYLYVQSFSSNSVTVIGTSNNTVIRQVHIQNPTYIAITPNGNQVYVENETGAVAEILNNSC